MAPSVILGLLLLAIPALGQNYFVNSTFTNPAMGGIIGGNQFTGWLFTNNDGVANGWTWQSGGVTTSGNWLCPVPPPTKDSQVAMISQGGLMRQTITVPSNGLYSLSFYVGTNGPYYNTESFTLQVNATVVNRWPWTWINHSAWSLIQTNLPLQAGANIIQFIGDTNAGTVGGTNYPPLGVINQGPGGLAVDFDGVQSAPYNLGYTVNTNTLTVTSDGSLPGTQNALAYVYALNQDGWTVAIGASGGVYTWSNGLSITPQRRMTVSGPSGAATTIVFNSTTPEGIYLALTNSLFTLANLTFNVATTNAPPNGIIGINGSGVCFRITGCTFLNSSLNGGNDVGINIGGGNSNPVMGPYGLIDHCNFPWPGGNPVNFVSVVCNGSFNHYGWSNSMTWGTTNCVCIENCGFSEPNTLASQYVCEGEGGLRICLRYCSMTNCEEGTHGIQSGLHDGALQVECYMNSFWFNYGGNTEFEAFISRGGSTLLWSNSFLQTQAFELGGGAQFQNECASAAWQTEFCATNWQYPTNYPSPQQVGRGVVGGAEGSVPVYVWGNTFNGSGQYIGLGTDPQSSQFIQQGRDIYTNSMMPGYTPLVYPSPLETTNTLPPAPPPPVTLTPLGNVANGQNLH